jgi:23S rRNA (uracil1939-C5)-methyltransferase
MVMAGAIGIGCVCMRSSISNGVWDILLRKVISLCRLRVVLLWPELEAAVHQVSQWLAPLPPTAQISEIEIAYSRADKCAAARITSSAKRFLLQQVAQKLPLAGVELHCHDGQLRYGKLEMRYDHGLKNEFDLMFEPGTFTQVFPEMNDKLVERVIAAVHPQNGVRVLEFHAGIGNFSIPLARSGARLVAVEMSKRSTVLLGRNARASGLTIDVHAVPDSQATNFLVNSDVVIFDPPRTGALDLCQALLTVQKAPARLIYVSCDPATLARDAKILGPRYQLSSLCVFDMFPQTPHVESLAIFDLR